MESLSGRKVVSTIMIIFGTTMLLGQQKKSSSLMEQNSYTMCAYFALSSGFCMASRNVLTKKKDDKVREQQQDNDDEESASSIITTTNTCREVFQKGLLNFATITIMSTLPAIIAISFYPWHYPKLLQLMLQHPPSSSSESNQSLLPQTVIFHCLYNMASITVLSLTSAPVHSLLNVGKRIANVIFASMVFGIIIPKEGKVGLIIVGVGTLIYNDKILAMLCSSGGGDGRRRKKSSLHRMTVHHGRVNIV
jgi:drug/metabolite transporter (DMT)-like permease